MASETIQSSRMTQKRQIKRFLKEITKEKRFRRPKDKGIDWADTRDTEDDLEERNEKGDDTVDRKERDRPSTKNNKGNCLYNINEQENGLK